MMCLISVRRLFSICFASASYAVSEACPFLEGLRARHRSCLALRTLAGGWRGQEQERKEALFVHRLDLTELEAAAQLP